MATASTWTDADTRRALEVWRKYQDEHNVSDRHGQAVGIDPETGEVHFGESAAEVVKRLAAEGRQPMLLFVRVGYNHYLKKVGNSALGVPPWGVSSVRNAARNFCDLPIPEMPDSSFFVRRKSEARKKV